MSEIAFTSVTTESKRQPGVASRNAVRLWGLAGAVGKHFGVDADIVRSAPLKLGVLMGIAMDKNGARPS